MRWTMMLVLAVWSLSMAIAAEEQLEFDYSRFSRITERLAGAGKYDRIVTKIRVFVPGKQIEPGKLVFTVLSASGPREIRPDAEGYLVLPNDPALNKENPKVRVNVPKGVELRFNVLLRCRVTPGQAIPYADLAECVEQYDDAIGEQAGLMAFAAPSAKGVYIRCGNDCVATLAGGTPPEIKADKNGVIEILHQNYRKTPNLTVRLSAPPTAVGPIIR